MMKDFNLEEELYKQVITGIGKSSFALMLNIIVVVIAFYDVVPISFLVLWSVFIALVLLLRFRSVNSYLKETTSIPIKNFIKHFKIYSVILAVSVSAGIIHILPINLPFHQAFLAMIVAGLSAGVVMAVSLFQTLTKIYLAIMILPFASVMLSYNDKIHSLIALLMYLFFIMLILFSKRFYINFVELTKSKDEIYRQAHYDHVTNLVNRHAFYERLSLEISKLKRSGHKAALLFIDMDNFKAVNDIYSHQTGDAVLKNFGDILLDSIREVDSAARIGGDEFIVLLSDIDKPFKEIVQIAEKLAVKIHKKLENPMQLGSNQIQLSVSIGIEIIDNKNLDIDTVLNNADRAMYVAKENGKKQTFVFNRSHLSI